MPDPLNAGAKAMVEYFGGEICVVGGAEGGLAGCVRLAEAKVKKGNVFLPQQFEDFYNIQAHQRTTGWEIWDQLEGAKKRLLAFIAGAGTGGTFMGVGNHLRSVYPTIKIHPVRPNEPDHRLLGLATQFMPHFLQAEKLNDPFS